MQNVHDEFAAWVWKPRWQNIDQLAIVARRKTLNDKIKKGREYVYEGWKNCERSNTRTIFKTILGDNIAALRKVVGKEERSWVRKETKSENLTCFENIFKRNIHKFCVDIYKIISLRKSLNSISRTISFVNNKLNYKVR